MNTDESKYDLDWSDVPEHMARIILHQGEVFLDAQLRTALSADQRAMIGASIFTGLAAAVLAATLAYWSASHDPALFLAGLATAVLMVSGGFCCMHAARPVDFNSPGGEPGQWWDERYGSLVVAMGGESENYQERIDVNDKVLRKNAKWLTWGIRLAWAAPIVGFIVWIFASQLGISIPA